VERLVVSQQAFMKNVIVGTAGHIDHGKSALVLALTGTDPDRLEEEKRRGITIDLGFAFLTLGDIRLGFVDVPGHERFVRNMLAGVGGIDLVLFVVAADESVKPQTREHFDICRLLAISRGITVLTKSDLVSPETLDLVRLEVEEFIGGSFLAGGAILPVSAKSGAGLDRLREELQLVGGEVPGKDSSRFFRLPVDRVFAMKGFGTVVTGTLVSGSVGKEDEVEILPQGKRVRVRGVQVHNEPTERAVAGQRTALNLAGVEVEELTRGMVLAPPEIFEPTDRVDVVLELLASAKPLKNHARVHFHQGTLETIAEVALLEGAALAPGGRAYAQLRLRERTLLLPGDPFIVRPFSPVITIGGGRVLDNLARPLRAYKHLARTGRPDTGVISRLQTFESGQKAQILAQILHAGSEAAVTLPRLMARTGWTQAEMRELLRQAQAAGKVHMLSEQPVLIAETDRLMELAKDTLMAVDAFHKANPLAVGIPKQELHEKVFGASPFGAELFRVVLEELAGTGKLEVAQENVKRAGREVPFRDDEARARAQIEEAFAKAGLKVPTVKEILAKLPVEAKRAQKILQLLLREKILVKVSEDLLFHQSAMTRLRELLAEQKKKGNQISVPAFKELTGVTRKYAIPLLEYLDREKVTRRVGDLRVIL